MNKTPWSAQSCLPTASMFLELHRLLLEPAPSWKQPAFLLPAGLETHHPSPMALQNKTPGGDVGSSAGQKQKQHGECSLLPYSCLLFSHTPKNPLRAPLEGRRAHTPLSEAPRFPRQDRAGRRLPALQNPILLHPEAASATRQHTAGLRR